MILPPFFYLKQLVDFMASEQFDKFWEIRCPKCNELIDLEILINNLKKRVKKIQVKKKD